MRPRSISLRSSAVNGIAAAPRFSSSRCLSWCPGSGRSATSGRVASERDLSVESNVVVRVDLPGEEPLTERADRHESDAELLERGRHVVLRLAPPQRILICSAVRRGPAVQPRAPLTGLLIDVPVELRGDHDLSRKGATASPRTRFLPPRGSRDARFPILVLEPRSIVLLLITLQACVRLTAAGLKMPADWPSCLRSQRNGQFIFAALQEQLGLSSMRGGDRWRCS